MPTVAEKPLPRLRPVAEIQTCFNCTDRERAFEFQRALMIAEIRRLEGELDRALAALRRDSHSMDPREPHRRKV